jgi:hypothetical protein
MPSFSTFPLISPVNDFSVQAWSLFVFEPSLILMLRIAPFLLVFGRLDLYRPARTFVSDFK